MRAHVKRTVSRCFAALRQLRQIRRAVPTTTFQMLVVALLHSRLDYGNAVLVGIPVYLVRRLQSVLKAAARLIYHLRPYEHISDALATPHWRRVPERVQYKIAVLTFKLLHDRVSRYRGRLVALADLPGWRALHSASTSRLVAPPIKLSTVGSRAFPFAAAQVWNGLSRGRRLIVSISDFPPSIKTHFFDIHTLS